MAAITPDMITPDLEARFWAKVDRRGDDECWGWLGKPTSRGYGRIQTKASKSTPAHHVSYVLSGDGIPFGKVIDHTCRQRLCVNPRHLRCVDPKTNTLENSLSPTAINSAKTHCKRGHALSGDNLLIDNGKQQPKRRCKQCAAKASLASYYKKRAAILQEKQQ